MTYRWKALNNFALYLISIGDLHTKLRAPKVARVPTLGILGEKAIWMFVPWPATKYTVGEGGSFPQIRVVVNLVSLWLPVVHSNTKVLQLCINQLVVWFYAGPRE